MLNRDLLDAFDDCINRLAAGQRVEDCLRAYPQYARDLAPMLEAGLLARRAHPTPAEIAAAQERARFGFERALNNSPVRRVSPLRRIAGMAASVLLVFVVLLSGAGVMAQDSLPGDALYGVKVTIESVRLFFSGDDAALQAEFGQRRVDETQRLLDLRREAEVTFEGILETIADDGRLVVAGVDVRLSGLSVTGLQTGQVVRVQARTTADGLLIARAVEIRRAAPQPEVAPTATPTASATPMPSATPTPSARSATQTPMPTFTAEVAFATNTPRPTRTPRATRTPTPSATPSATATVTPTRTAQPLRPASEPTACVPTRPPGWFSYRIQAGDTLSALAARTGTIVDTLMRVNCIEDPRMVYAGQLIYLPQSPQGPTAPTPGDTGGRGGTPPSGDTGGRGDSPPPSVNDDDDDDGDMDVDD